MVIQLLGPGPGFCRWYFGEARSVVLLLQLMSRPPDVPGWVDLAARLILGPWPGVCLSCPLRCCCGGGGSLNRGLCCRVASCQPLPPGHEGSCGPAGVLSSGSRARVPGWDWASLSSCCCSWFPVPIRIGCDRSLGWQPAFLGLPAWLRLGLAGLGFLGSPVHLRFRMLVTQHCGSSGW